MHCHSSPYRSFAWVAALAALTALARPHSSLADDMDATTFSDYALSETLTPDATYTVELLIERARKNFDPNHWDEFLERADARATQDYQPHFSEDHVSPAEKELKKLSWLSLQRLRKDERPVRDLKAVRFLPELSGLVLVNNEIADISPVAACAKLKCLDLRRNPIRDISPLAACTNIEELDLCEIPVEDFSVLESLPGLRELTISSDQIPAFRRLKHLPALRKLELGLDTFDSFEGFPRMPELRVIRGAHVSSLQGLEKFPKLENLVNLSGDFISLEPLRGSKALTHANILGSRVQSLEPLSGLLALRDLWVSTEATDLDVTPLESLPTLHEVTVECDDEELPLLARLRATLPSWDIEFRTPKPRHTPSLELEVVDQRTFDVYDTEKRFNLSDSDTNEGLLGSELDWLDDQIEEVLSVDFEEGDDYSIPCQMSGGRSRTVVLLSDRAVEAFPRLVLGIQKVLSHANKDWIIYFQSDGVETEEEFVVWIYPWKIMVTEEYEETVRNLIKPK